MGNDIVSRVIEDLRRGKLVIVTDDESRENEGDLVVAAEFTTPEVINFMAREARGLICVAMTGADLDRLDLPLMVTQTENGSGFGSPFTVSVDARIGVTTGISAFDRARTIEVLTDPHSASSDLSSPGHIFPLRAHDDGLEGRRGHTEAGVDLARAAGLFPASVICEIMSEDGTMARHDELQRFAERHDLPVVSIDSLSSIDVTRPQSSTVRLVESAELPTAQGQFTVTAFRDKEGLDHLALHIGSLDDDRPGRPAVSKGSRSKIRISSNEASSALVGLASSRRIARPRKPAPPVTSTRPIFISNLQRAC